MPKYLFHSVHSFFISFFHLILVFYLLANLFCSLQSRPVLLQFLVSFIIIQLSVVDKNITQGMRNDLIFVSYACILILYFPSVLFLFLEILIIQFSTINS